MNVGVKQRLYLMTVLWRRIYLHIKTTLPPYYTPHYKPTPPFFGVQKVENIIIKLYIYIQTHTDTPYMLNTVNISLVSVEFLLRFKARVCTPFNFLSNTEV